MNLAIDIGNTYTHLAVFNNNKIIKNTDVLTNSKAEYTKAIIFLYNKYKQKIKNIGISTVVPKAEKFIILETVKHFKINPLTVNYKSKLPVKIKVKNPGTLGADRICNAVFGYEYFERKNNVIIADMGTANNYEVVLKNGDFIGGIIHPGIGTSAVALNLKTGKLPLPDIADLKVKSSVIGKNTYDAIQSGLLNSAIFTAKMFISSVEKEYNSRFKVIVTGGFGLKLKKYIKKEAVYRKNTVLDGINCILNYQ